MKTSKTLCLAISAVFALSAFTGCGGGSGSGKTVITENPKVNEEAKTDLSFIRPGQDPDKADDPVNMAIKEYEETYGVKVNINVADYTTWTSKVLTASASGTPIDVIFGSVSEYPVFALKKYTQPIKEYVDVNSSYVNKSAMEAFFSYQGEIYNAAGKDVAPLVMYYNKDMIANEGLQDPLELYQQGNWTFSVFKDMCKKLTTDTDQDGQINRWGLANWYAWAFLGANHTALCKITAEGKYELNFLDPAVTQTLEFVQDAYFTSKWRGIDGDNIFTSFYQGKNAFLNEYSWVEREKIIPAQKEEQFDFEYGVVPMPYGPNNTEKVNVGHASGYGIGTGSKSPYHAGQLISMILNKTMEDTATKNKELPKDHLALYEELSKNVYNDTYYDSAINNGSDLFGLICGGSNIQTSLDQVKPLFQGAIDDANDAAAE